MASHFTISHWSFVRFKLLFHPCPAPSASTMFIECVSGLFLVLHDSISSVLFKPYRNLFLSSRLSSVVFYVRHCSAPFCTCCSCCSCSTLLHSCCAAPVTSSLGPASRPIVSFSMSVSRVLVSRTGTSLPGEWCIHAGPSEISSGSRSEVSKCARPELEWGVQGRFLV